METGCVTAIVLAAGESRRMGTLKPLLPYGPQTVIQAVVRSLQASLVDEVLVVLGHRKAEIAAELADTGVTLVENPDYPEGMLSSVRAGITAAAPNAEWLVIALGDQPSLRPETVARLLAEARAGPETIVVPSYGGRRGHPLVFHARYRAEILALASGRGLKELLERHPNAIRHVVFEDEAVLADMDTPEEYRRELRRLERSPGE